MQILSPKKRHISSLLLDNCDYLINKWQIFETEHAPSWFKKLERTKKIIRVGKISGKGDILTVQEKERAHKGN